MSITVEKLYELIQQGLSNSIIIDVRNSFECKGGIIPGAKNIPLREIIGVVEDLKKYTTVYLICASGGRSAYAIQELSKGGLTNLCDVLGGMSGWVSRGYQIEMPA